MKLVEKITGATNSNVVFSFEFYSPRTDNGVDNLIEKMERMSAHNPLFYAITWRADGSTADITLDIARRMQKVVCVETIMHLTCHMAVDKIDHALETIKANGVQNVLALRGDPLNGQDKFVAVDGGFSCALELVKHIRAKYGDYFGIAVAGYPEAHPCVIESDGLATPQAYEDDLAYLKSKVDAGADLIVTQLFYDTDIFLKFVDDCRQIGITCPIVPGIMPINNYEGFKKRTALFKTKIPAEIEADLEPIKDNAEAVRAYGVHLATEMCKKILSHGIKTLHLYTLNSEKSALAILMFMRPLACDKKLQDEWVVPLKSVEDIHEIFAKYCIGSLRTNPWLELDGLQPEATIIDEKLGDVNQKGFLTINSQPAVNGATSEL